MAQDTSYAPYGENYGAKGSFTADLDFTGQFQDTVAGLYDFLYREYSPVQGRWISPDPSGANAVDPTNPQSWNRYAYVLNNPLSNVDPLGLDCVYLGDDGDNIESIDTHSNGDECGNNGGFWVDGTFTRGWYSSNSNDIYLQGNDNGLFTDAYINTVNTNSPGGVDTTSAALFGNSFAANNSTVSVGYTVNVIASFFYGLGPAFTYTKVPSLNLKCVGGGIGASAGHNFSFGPTVVSTQNAKGILSSFSFSAGYNFTPWLGGGGSVNSSGAASGNTFGVPGAGAAVTWSKCWGG